MSFTDPFRYIPEEAVRRAAKEVFDNLSGEDRRFDEGKMLGVLVVEHPESRKTGFIAAFSGTVRGDDGIMTATADGFVPPINDLTERDGYYKRKEAEISRINSEIERLETKFRESGMEEVFSEAVAGMERELEEMSRQMKKAKERRRRMRIEVTDSVTAEKLDNESRFEKAEYKRLKDRWKSIIKDLSGKMAGQLEEIEALKHKRTRMSENLQKWIFTETIVHNAKGEALSIWDIFTSKGLIPPGGTGECAAPKLLEHAYRNGLRPIAMGEFWYGRSPETAVRTQGHFYPSCTSKCGPLLSFMMQGLLPQEEKEECGRPVVIYEDAELIVVEKPHGMPSVPGLDGRKSLHEWLLHSHEEVHAVHRLDMDTSGVMLFAKTEEAASNLQRQFEAHTIRKEYKARLSAADPGCMSSIPPKGRIGFPLAADYDERPRQKADTSQGKDAITEYEVIGTNPDGTTDIIFRPLTGRTHQLRVHAAHSLGLRRAILGDLLYGSYTIYDNCISAPRLCLHALGITFRHPADGSTLTFRSDRLSY